MVGLSYKYNAKIVDKNRGLGKLFPTYGIAGPNESWNTTRKRLDVPTDQLYNEV